MPITHVVDTERRVLVFAVTGTVSTAEMLAAVDAAVAGVDAGRYRVLSDHRGLTTPSTTAQLEALIAHLTKFRAIFGGSRWAVVVAQPASFGMMRMLSVLAERIPIRVEVFTDLAAAQAWLETPGAGGMTA
jgi:hypothetical protein